MQPHLKPKEYDIRIIKAVRALRELRQLKLVNLANELGMTESNYYKIEKGYKAIIMGQLRIIDGALNVSVFMIPVLAGSDHLAGEKVERLSDIAI